MMKKYTVISMISLTITGITWGHVQLMVPNNDTMDGQKGAVREMDIRFLEHASKNGPLLPMGKPKEYGVLVNSKKYDLKHTLKAVKKNDKIRYTSTFKMKEAGAHVMYLEPASYWEATEQVMVTHYTKVIFNSCGAGIETESHLGWENWEGWHQMVGFPVEIEPLLNCTALWTGSVFRGVLYFKNKPAAFSRIEVEYYNENHDVKQPNNSYITQIIKTDAHGQFSFILLKEGWWAFTAIPESSEVTENPDGKDVGVEMGGVLIVRANDLE
ncbi:MAG: DUF4198 domain-containing protein [Pontiella sp.]